MFPFMRGTADPPPSPFLLGVALPTPLVLLRLFFWIIGFPFFTVKLRCSVSVTGGEMFEMASHFLSSGVGAGS